MQQDRHKGRQHNTAHPHSTGHQGEVLTLSFEFPNNYSQKCVLWRNMTPPDRHGAPPQNNDDKKSLAVQVSRSPKTPSVKFSRMTSEARGGSPFSLSPVSHPRKKISPSLFSLPTPRASLISTPTRPRLSASQRLPCAPRQCEAEKKGVGKPQFHQHFTDAPRKHCARLCRRVSECARGGLLL